MDISVYRPGELTAADRAAWTALQSKAHLPRRAGAGEPVPVPGVRARRGPLPARGADRGRPGGRRARRRSSRTRDPPSASAEPIGLGISDCQGVVHRPGFTWDAQELLRACGLAVWEFDHLAEGQTPFEAAATGTFPSPVMDVDQGYEAYLGQLRARLTEVRPRTTLAKERKLGRDAGEVRYVHDERDPAALRTLMDWKSAQYRRTGSQRPLRARRGSPGLVHRLFHTRSESFAGQPVRAVRGTASLSPPTSGCAPSGCSRAGSRRTTRRSRSTRRAWSCICGWPRRPPPTASPTWTWAGGRRSTRTP